MICGDIVKFETKKVLGRERRLKYHLCISLSDGLFLFINSDPFDGAFEILRADWPEMPKNVSYISCNAKVTYTAAELRSYSIAPSGRLTDGALAKLMDHINESDVMPEEDIDASVNAIASHLRTEKNA